jgi:hypothetical protein
MGSLVQSPTLSMTLRLLAGGDADATCKKMSVSLQGHLQHDIKYSGASSE